MRIFLCLVFIFSIVPNTFALVANNGCPGKQEWVEEIQDCAFVEYNESDRVVDQKTEQAEGWKDKLDDWQQDFNDWKKVCFAPSPTINFDAPKGVIHYFTGRIFVVRGTAILPAEKDMILEPGDMVTVEEDSSVDLDLRDSGLMSLTQPTKYQVSSSKSLEGFWGYTKNWIDTAWNRTKRCINPSDLTPDEGEAGARG